MRERTKLTNKCVSIKLRLRLFDAFVTPTILCGLISMPLTTSDLNQLDAIQRRMLRSLVGWVCVHDVSYEWARAISFTFSGCHKHYKLETLICKSIFSLATKAAGTCGWPKHVVKWCPFNNWQTNPQQQVRSRGRPPKRWDDNSKFFFFAQRLTQKGSIVPGARFFSHEFSRATVLVTCLCDL